MTIAERLEKYKVILIYGAVLLAGAAGIGLGILISRDRAGKDDTLWIEQLSEGERTNATIMATTTPEKPAEASQAAAVAAAVPQSQEVVASKTGTVYYLPTCSGAGRIKPENKVTYPTRAAAEAKGLKPAKNCSGM